MSPLVAVVQVCIPNKTFTPHRGGCPLSLDIYPFLGVTFVQMKENESHAERTPPLPMGSNLYDIV